MEVEPRRYVEVVEHDGTTYEVDTRLHTRRILLDSDTPSSRDIPDVGIHVHNLAALLEKKDGRREAEALYRRELAIKQAAHGPKHPSTKRSAKGLRNVLESAAATPGVLQHSTYNAFDNTYIQSLEQQEDALRLQKDTEAAALRRETESWQDRPYGGNQAGCTMGNFDDGLFFSEIMTSCMDVQGGVNSDSD